MKRYTPLLVLLAAVCGFYASQIITPVYADGIPYFDNLGAVNEGTVTGDAVTKLNVLPTSNQKGITITNEDASNALWIKPVSRNAPAPTFTKLSTYPLFKIAAGSSVHIQCGGGVDWYGCNSTDASTTSIFTTQGWR